MAKTILQIQQMITDKHDPREIMNEIADYLQANPGGGGGIESIVEGDGISVDDSDPLNPVVSVGYKSYAINIRGGEGVAPTITEFANQIGAEEWVRVDDGDYHVECVEAFPVDKVYVVGVECLRNANAIETVKIPIYRRNTTEPAGFYKLIIDNFDGNTIIYFDVYNSDNEFTDLPIVTADPDIGFDLPEIRVYP